MKKLTLPFIGVCLTLLFMTGCPSQDTGEAQKNAPTPGTGVMIISYSDAAADTFPAVGVDSIVVLDWLKAACDSAAIPLEIKEYTFGDLVVGIGEQHSGDGGDWLYQVNGQMVPEAASSHRVSSGDSVRFFFE